MALALDPLELHALAVRDANGWQLTVMGKVPVAHPNVGEVTVLSFGGVELTMQRALLWHLQETGWLNPYSAVWTWKLRADDPRLTILAKTR